MDNSRFVFKEGHGTASNACYWKVCYDKYTDIYTAMLSFGGAGGSSSSFYHMRLLTNACSTPNGKASVIGDYSIAKIWS